MSAKASNWRSWTALHPAIKHTVEVDVETPDGPRTIKADSTENVRAAAAKVASLLNTDQIEFDWNEMQRLIAKAE